MFRTGQAFHSKGNINNRRSIDTLRQRRGNLRQRGKTDDDSGIWVRSRGGQMEGDGWDSRYNIFQLGYEYSDTAGSVYGFFGERGIASPDYEPEAVKNIPWQAAYMEPGMGIMAAIQILWLKLVVMIQRLIPMALIRIRPIIAQGNRALA